jgi:RNA polymerase sigma factor (sigma-70 family)
MTEDQLVADYSSMVWSIVRKFNIVDKSRLDEFYQGGLIGLIMAHRKFDKSKNVSFKTYAYNEIKWHILEIIDADKRWRSSESFKERSNGHLNTDCLIDLSQFEKEIAYEKYVLKKSVVSISKNYNIDRRKVTKILRQIEQKINV